MSQSGGVGVNSLDGGAMEIDPSPWDSWISIYRQWHDSLVAFSAEPGFYRRLADQHRGLVVELGCGDGRLFEAVRPDLGLDTSARMLEAAARNTVGVRTAYGDICTYRLTDPATFSYAPMNVLNHLPDREAQDVALANVRANTVSGGVFAFDALSTTIEEVRRRNGEYRYQYRNDEFVVQAATRQVGAGTEMEFYVIVDEIDSEGVVTRRRHLSPVPLVPRAPAEWIESARQAGWHIEATYAGYDTDEPATDAGWQVIVLTNP